MTERYHKYTGLMSSQSTPGGLHGPLKAYFNTEAKEEITLVCWEVNKALQKPNDLTDNEKEQLKYAQTNFAYQRQF